MSVEEEEEEDLNMYAEQDSAGIGQEETLEAVEDDRHARPGGEVTNYEDGTSDGTYNAEEINEHVFEELRLPYGVVQQVQDAWDAYLRPSEEGGSAPTRLEHWGGGGAAAGPEPTPGSSLVVCVCVRARRCHPVPFPHNCVCHPSRPWPFGFESVVRCVHWRRNTYVEMAC